MSGAVRESFALVAAYVAGETAALVVLLQVREASGSPDAVFRALTQFLPLNISEIELSAIKGFCRAIQEKIEGGAQ